MNKERRKVLASIEADATKYNEELRDLVNEANKAIVTINEKIVEIKDDILNALVEARDEEQEYFDNMSEGLQSGDKGQVAQEAIEQLEAAIGFLEGLDELDELNEIDLDTEVVQPVNTAGA